MPRKKTQRNNQFPYHVYNRVLSQKNYPAELLPQIWRIYCEELCVLSWAFDFKIHLFVMMSNHYHLIVETPEANIAQGMMHFQRETSKRVKEITYSQDFRFQTRYKWKLIEHAYQYQNTYHYIASNPVKAGLSNSPLDYPYSTLHGQFGNAALWCPLFERSPFSALLPDCMEKREAWLRCQV